MSKMKELWGEYEKYQEQVLNRVAHSVGCEPSDLDNDDLVLDCFINNISIHETARKVEHSFMTEIPF